MAKKQTAPAAPATQVQQPEKLPYYLEALRPIFELLERFVEGEKGVQEKLRSDVAAARQNKDHKGNIDAALGKLVVIGGLPMSLFGDVLDEKSARWLTRKADEFVRCAAETNTTIQAWSRDEARRVLDLYKAKQGTSAKPSRVMAILATHTSAFPVLESWAYPRPRATKEQTKPALEAVKKRLELETKLTTLEAQESEAAKLGTAEGYARAGELAGQIAALRQEMANLTTTTAAAPADAEVDEAEEVDETSSIEEQIAELETQRDEAATAKDYAKAGEIATQIAALRNEAEAEVAPSATTTAAAPEPTPVPVVAPVATAAAAASPAVQPAGTSEFTVDDAVDLCTSETASSDLKRLLERRQGKGKPLTDAEFVRKVQLLAKL